MYRERFVLDLLADYVLFGEETMQGGLVEYQPSWLSKFADAFDTGVEVFMDCKSPQHFQQMFDQNIQRIYSSYSKAIDDQMKKVRKAEVRLTGEKTPACSFAEYTFEAPFRNIKMRFSKWFSLADKIRQHFGNAG